MPNKSEELEALEKIQDLLVSLIDDDTGAPFSEDQIKKLKCIANMSKDDMEAIKKAITLVRGLTSLGMLGAFMKRVILWVAVIATAWLTVSGWLVDKIREIAGS